MITKTVAIQPSYYRPARGMNRVAVKSYNDINTAYAELNNLRQALNNEGLWILQN